MSDSLKYRVESYHQAVNPGRQGTTRVSWRVLRTGPKGGVTVVAKYRRQDTAARLCDLLNEQTHQEAR